VKMIPHLYRKQPQIFRLSKMGEKFGVWSFKMCSKIKRITGLLMRKMIPDLCSRGSFFLKLNSELYGAENWGIDYAEGSYISKLPLMQKADLEIIRYLFLPFRCTILRTYR
jgi:hypothetical protein